jgi:hypothetical protein
MKKKILIGATLIGLLAGSGGVLAGTLIKQGKTPRGNQYSVEKETVEKNKFEVKINGKAISGGTVTVNGKVYIPLSGLPSDKFTDRTYNAKKWSYNINAVENFALKRDLINYLNVLDDFYKQNVNTNQILRLNLQDLIQNQISPTNQSIQILSINNEIDKLTKRLIELKKQKDELNILYTKVNPLGYKKYNVMLNEDLIEITKVVSLAQQAPYKISHPDPIFSIPEKPIQYPYDFRKAIELLSLHRTASEKIHQTIQTQLNAIK